MSTRAVTLHLPNSLYTHLEQTARAAKRSLNREHAFTAETGMYRYINLFKYEQRHHRKVTAVLVVLEV